MQSDHNLKHHRKVLRIAGHTEPTLRQGVSSIRPAQTERRLSAASAENLLTEAQWYERVARGAHTHPPRAQRCETPAFAPWSTQLGARRATGMSG